MYIFRNEFKETKCLIVNLHYSRTDKHLEESVIESENKII